MSYATALDLITRFDAEEIAQRADRIMPRRVFGPLLTAVASSADLSDYDVDEVAQAGVAMIRVQRALDDARDAINSYISSKYSLPIFPVPAILQRLACDLARFYLYDDTATEQVKDRHTAAMKLLDDVRAGKAQLGADAATGEQPPSSAGAELVSGERVWQRDRSKGFI
ncbi:gp436 family protein [Variovorax sp. VNK109]|uniref:gp436 family protein n=1 Tax=Variovorax sp. VNK109 TaxID=3400919 RepID=UPI003C0A5FFC